jgi:hypothetical protein
MIYIRNRWLDFLMWWHRGEIRERMMRYSQNSHLTRA